MKTAEARLNDTPEMIEAITVLTSAGVDVRRPPDHGFQLKVSPELSYYPTTKRIVFDGKPAEEEKGLDTLIKLLRTKNIID